MGRFVVRDGALQIFDVNHGQCALLTLPSPIGMRYVLIDCGHSVDLHGSPWYPGEHLQGMGIKYIDFLVCTNYDEDHASGYPDLTRRGIAIGCILGNPTVSPEAIMKLKTEDGMGDGIRDLATTLTIRRAMNWAQVPPTIPGLDLTWAWNPYPYFDDENNLSLVLALRVHGFCFMFPGDMETRGFENLLQTCRPLRQLVAGVHVLVAAHHGRKNGICPAMFDVYGCKPQLVIISDDYKQYDTQETTAYYARKTRGILWFRDEGARYVLTTRNDGEIIFSFHAGSCRVW
jgi:beta-lactamase superfamily II metal-dependent hydrolase